MADGKIFNLNDMKNKPQPQAQPHQLTRQDVIDAPDVQCMNCGGELFLPATRFKRISKLLLGEAEDKLVNIQTMVCANCGMELNPMADVGKGNIPDKKDLENDEPTTAFDE